MHVFRLTKPGCFETCELDTQVPAGSVVVRPRHLAICAADQRYWSGNRDPEALKKKLPMALIHEAIGEVVADPAGQLAPGTSVVMVPNMPDPNDADTESKENYSRASKFCSSGTDGFMRDYVIIPSHRLVPCDGVDPLVAVMGELVSVCVNALEAFEQVRHVNRCGVFGVWGDGAVGYLMAALLRHTYPESTIYLFGGIDEKMELFDFVDAKFNVLDPNVGELPLVDHAFEAVGGLRGCEAAIAQIIDLIRPQGVISLMGVSEVPVPILTRMVLEKGLTLQGNSRSSKEDFARAVELFREPEFAERVRKVVTEVRHVETIEDADAAFADDAKNPFKTVMEWEIPCQEWQA